MAARRAPTACGSAGAGHCAIGSRALAPALTAPLLWALTDLVVTGDPLFSLRHTDALAAELHREVPLTHLPWMLVTCWSRSSSRRCCSPAWSARGSRSASAAPRSPSPCAVAVLTCFTYLVIASGGLATVYRYLLLTALGVSLLAAFAVSGWTLLPKRPSLAGALGGARRRACLLGAAWTFAHLTLAGIRNDLRERRAVRADLRAVLTDPAVVAARALRPDHRAEPQADPRGPLAARPPRVGAVRARSDRSLGAAARRRRAGDRRPTIEERPALNVYEVPADGTGILAAPRSFHRLAAQPALRGLGRVRP